MKHIISVLVENRFGVLARIAGLFSARGFNIDSLAVGETEDPSISRMTIVVRGDDKILEQVKKQLNKLIDIISVKDYVNKEHIDRELLLFKIGSTKSTKPKILKALKALNANIVKDRSGDITVEFIGSPDETTKLFKALEGYTIKEMVRTGRIAMAL
jgi:acetolactate synthase-1/3 small subunit